MPLTIYHNPRCSKSRQTLALIEASGVAPNIVRYLDTPPSAAEILKIAGLLNVGVADLLRTGESDYKDATDLPPSNDAEALANWLAAHPRVLQRPIVIDDRAQRAVIGRPPENVNALLTDD